MQYVAVHLMSNTALTEWFVSLNRWTSILLVTNTIALVALAANQDYTLYSLHYERNNTLVAVGSTRLNAMWCFAMSALILAVGHMWLACSPRTAVKLLRVNRNPYRWGILVLSTPPLHVGMLVGVAHVESVWAFYACCVLLLTMCTMMWLVDGSTAWKPRVVVTGLVAGLYTTFWAFLWWTGDRQSPIAICSQIMLVITLLLCIAVFGAVRPGDVCYKEAALTVSAALLHVGSPWIWVTSQINPHNLAPWSAMCAIVFLGGVGATIMVRRIKAVGTVGESPTHIKLLDQTEMVEPCVRLDSNPYEQDDVINEGETVSIFSAKPAPTDIGDAGAN